MTRRGTSCRYVPPICAWNFSGTHVRVPKSAKYGTHFLISLRRPPGVAATTTTATLAQRRRAPAHGTRPYALDDDDDDDARGTGPPDDELASCPWRHAFAVWLLGIIPICRLSLIRYGTIVPIAGSAYPTYLFANTSSLVKLGACWVTRTHDMSMKIERTKVVGYCRVSTKMQASEGLSLEAQKRKLVAYAEALDLDLIEVIVDAGFSAKTLCRPGITRALKMLDLGEADGVLVCKLDRLTRSVRDLGDLLDRYFGAKHSLLSIGDSIDTRSAGGRLVLNVLASVAQWERESTGERVKDGLAEAKRQGAKIGREGHGWKRTGELDANGRRVVERDAGEARAIDRIRALRAGGETLQSISDTLTAEGHATKRGGNWQPATILRILRRQAA